MTLACYYSSAAVNSYYKYAFLMQITGQIMDDRQSDSDRAH